MLGARWKAMGEEEKQQYLDKHAALKDEYEAKLQALGLTPDDVKKMKKGPAKAQAPKKQLSEEDQGDVDQLGKLPKKPLTGACEGGGALSRLRDPRGRRTTKTLPGAPPPPPPSFTPGLVDA